jgi:branched-chain amino acid transport system substrate-binding protein
VDWELALSAISSLSSIIVRALAVAGAASAAAGLGGCTLSRTDVSDCETNLECRDAFGIGSVCNADGLCEKAELSPRCTQTDPPGLLSDPDANRDRIVFGNLMDRSVATHVARERSAQLAYDQVNEEEGVDGRQFGAVFCTIEESDEFDGLSREEAAKASAEFLVDVVGVPAIVGPAASTDTQAVFQDVGADGVLVISPSATSPALTQLDPPEVSNEAPGLLWRTAPSDALQGVVIAADMLDPGEGREFPVGRVAVIHEVGAYGDGLYEVFSRAFTAAGGEPPDEHPFEGEGQLTDAIADVGADPDTIEVLFISAQASLIAAFLESAAALESYDNKTIFLTDAAANPDVLKDIDSALATRVRGTRPAPLDPARDLVYSSFIAAYTAAYRDDVQAYSFAANAYDAAWLLIYGATWALLREDGLSGRNIARGLRHVSSGQNIEVRPTGWVSVLQAFRQGQSVDVTGASGELDYDPGTEETTTEIQVWKVVNEEAVGIYQL